MLRKNLDKIIIGSALAIAASALLPIAKSTLRPIAKTGMQGGANLFNRGRSFIQIARQEVEDIIAEAQFERMKKQLDKEIALLDDDEK
ncbi:DUF5132 domain-containing protein [Paenibacillus radicis (ex Xue et al. 2023)]|uniref:DUF5132 domain-containing protein n=1 Tax=Paenibacillus radicis (ex Xue et al. 2023) TaxID=2972489 RepID=A0ABT1YB47_9BACL|nr:DUF5132 domain-containing protein [Paenibacillus radicis (ex Xue et al. 2023)]MCR8630412.1 DUF5132 domain-containing protein [Paenibacillus radicis (ex Xue et al. 2023)]